ncbi:uncharacterized protein agap3 isoform X3 [Silurus meridionalis]|uniref:uncharacterized protein agap3 isoform X3 n=1 Tax=Silurus meridionalis TaxID=175797 RepID=UPI001EECDAF6|nr:uncharacterized protein agap3 isoform X3 [Silurus meridionalis]
MRTDRFPALLQDCSQQRFSGTDINSASNKRTQWIKDFNPASKVGCIPETEYCNGEVTADCPVVVLRRSTLEVRHVGSSRKTVSMYGSLDEPQQQGYTTVGHEYRSQRPHSVCMLAAAKSSSVLVTHSSSGKERYSDRLQERRCNRALDGLKQDMPPSFRLPSYSQQEVLPRRTLQTSGKPRPVSMTVLELKESIRPEDELANRTFSDAASLPRSGFRWRLFGRQAQDKEAVLAPTSTKPDRPKKRFSSLRRSLSLRLKRNCNPPEQDAVRERTWTTNARDVARPNQPFSYLTGRTLSSAYEHSEHQRGKQVIEFQTRGKVSVIEVPLAPPKLTKPFKPTSSEPNFWQLITSRFKRKSNKSEACAESQQSGTGPPAWNKKPQPVTIETLKGIDFSKGQDSFVNSQEWTLSRSVPELKVGIVGNLSSGKSALVHRYLTGTYVQEESPEGGRFKKEIVVDGQSYLLLIRDEGGPPELQFAAWVDAVVFVFSLEDEISFQTVYNYFLRLSSYRNTAEVPMVLVGTQDAISATNPRVIDDARARKLSNDLKRSTYYETCSTYGLNVERVFQDVAQKVVALRKKQQLAIGPCKSLPNSPSHTSVPAAAIPSVHLNQATNGGGVPFSDYSSSVPSTPSMGQREMRIETIAASNTPTPIRKQSKRRSNIFTSRKASEQAKSSECKTDSIGSGRAIPIKQAFHSDLSFFPCRVFLSFLIVLSFFLIHLSLPVLLFLRLFCMSFLLCTCLAIHHSSSLSVSLSFLLSVSLPFCLFASHLSPCLSFHFLSCFSVCLSSSLSVCSFSCNKSVFSVIMRKIWIEKQAVGFGGLSSKIVHVFILFAKRGLSDNICRITIVLFQLYFFSWPLDGSTVPVIEKSREFFSGHRMVVRIRGSPVRAAQLFEDEFGVYRWGKR